jgi:hypothetical protein
MRSPPSCIEGFALTLLPFKEGGLELSAEFALSCRKCGANVFRVTGFPLVAPDPSPYYLVRPGEILFRPPHRLICVCGATVPLFDARTQGYDGILNGGCAYESGKDGDREGEAAGRYTVEVSFLYNIELAELTELAAEAHVKPSDLFDGFSAACKPIDRGEALHLDYECA